MEDRDGVTAANATENAIISRRSTRGFLPKAIPLARVEHLLKVAARAPSGSNMQPWRVHVVTGTALAKLSQALIEAHESGQPERPDYRYYPDQWRSPYSERRRATGWGLYELAGVKRGDFEGSKRQQGRNYQFFGAPVALIFSIDDDLAKGSWLDYGMFLQSLMIAASADGLNTCPQQSIANYPDVVRSHTGIPANQTVICAMALGYSDPTEPTNALRTSRMSVAEFVTVHD